MWRGRGGIDDAVLAELRAIRQEIHDLATQVSQSATREDLKRYVTLEAFEDHQRSHQNMLENWRTWLPWALGFGLGIYELTRGLHP